MLHKLEKKLHKYEEKYMGGQDPNRVQALTAMGFPEDRARAALRQTNGDVAAAANILASNAQRVAGGYPGAAQQHQQQPVMYTPQYPGGQQQPQYPPQQGYYPPPNQTPAYGGYPPQQPYYPPPPQQQGGYAPIVPQYPPQQQPQQGYGPGGYPPQAPQQYPQQYPQQQQQQPSAPPMAMAGGGRKKALLIGINYTGTRAQLRGCVNDVRKMRQYLSQRGGFPDSPQTMLVLTDDQRGANSPTRDNILRGIQWLVAGAQPGDSLFFHYSGHGGQQRDQSGHEEDGYDETILPLDYQKGHITDDEIWRLMVAPLPSGTRLTAVMDCCHSGTGMDLAYNWNRHSNRWIEETNPAHAAADVRLFSGCDDAQTSADTQGLFEAGGAMTIAFLQALESGQRYTYRTFLDALHAQLRQRGFSQRPSLSATQRFNVDTPFGLNDSVPNSNPQLGRLLRKRKKPKRHFGGGLGDILIAGAVGYLAVNAAVGAAGLLGGLLFGGFD
eukprot:TRINITY_DN2404_c0_g1_i1.p1 TRINITY_DN2404_c0_g1~~TRINITY_DN2404_c0_g1_i1.p1  ORF type:complete len:497 (+),score=104.82 TRINITY_DN2404_c0_g1_i1:94-1584(+)